MANLSCVFMDGSMSKEISYCTGTRVCIECRAHTVITFVRCYRCILSACTGEHNKCIPKRYVG